MRHGIILAGAAVLAVAVLFLAWYLVRPRSGSESSRARPAERASPGQASVPLPVKVAEPARAMNFGTEEEAGPVTVEVERVVRAGRAATALARPGGEARWVCILVDAEERYYELDSGWSPGDFPDLTAAGFRPPPEPVSRTMSIYRSVAKPAMGYRADRGDRIVVLLCPKAAWGELHLRWPAPPAR